MNKQNHADAKLREAAKQIYNEAGDESCAAIYLLGATSEAAREYWQSWKPKIDVFSIQQQLLQILLSEYMNDIRISNIFKVFENHLNPTKQEPSDAVEFAEWLLNNYRTSSLKNGFWINPQELNDNYYTIEQLYTEFKNQKG